MKNIKLTVDQLMDLRDAIVDEIDVKWSKIISVFKFGHGRTFAINETPDHFYSEIIVLEDFLTTVKKSIMLANLKIEKADYDIVPYNKIFKSQSIQSRIRNLKTILENPGCFKGKDVCVYWEKEIIKKMISDLTTQKGLFTEELNEFNQLTSLEVNLPDLGELSYIIEDYV